ncbi:hypothetical protein LOD99_10367 [Oopsacas minuta]|uniref:Uncharacterized protein n=1 Tax=Oopsacas minuta TaxID=111878 RepID=A0AAV7KIA4_9METZ|nr:hypothetical protein LOD99_10367 [Oopsacas minuta]
MAELKRLSENCGFGETLQDMLRDRLVCDIKMQVSRAGYFLNLSLRIRRDTTFTGCGIRRTEREESSIPEEGRTSNNENLGSGHAFVMNSSAR